MTAAFRGPRATSATVAIRQSQAVEIAEPAAGACATLSSTVPLAYAGRDV